MAEVVTLDDATASAVSELVPVLRGFCRSGYGIAVGGAHAKGTADEESDLDLYVFASSVLGNEARAARVRECSPAIENLVSWGDEDPFVQGGTDFERQGQKVECWLRHSGYIDQTITNCRAGVVEHTQVTWTPMGFYSYCALSDLKAMVPIEDPEGMLARWQEAIAVYPPKLREAIIDKHLGAARFWPHNFHYTSAVKRLDVMYTTTIVQQVVHNLIQTLFAMNEVYFPGDKKLAAALEYLERVPEGFGQQVQRLVFPGREATADMLREQQTELQRLLAETEALVAGTR
jgi:hypothetical protein